MLTQIPTQTLTLILTLIPTLALTQTLTQTEEKHFFASLQWILQFLEIATCLGSEIYMQQTQQKPRLYYMSKS